MSIQSDRSTILELWADLSDENLARFTLALQRDLVANGIATKPAPKQTEGGQKGLEHLLGQLAIDLAASGAVTVLLECLKAYIARERSLKCKLRRPEGVELEISSKNIGTPALKELLESLKNL